ncbi:MAG: MaoC family dehydratase [Rhodospirillales bacterium]
MKNPTPTRVAEDARGKRTTYEEIEVGKDLGSLEWTVTEEDIEKQCSLDEDWHEWYVLNSPWGGRVAPPQIQSRPPRWLLGRIYNIRGVFYKHDFEFLKPIKPGQTLIVSGRISDKWIKNDREFVRWDTVAKDEHGDAVFTASRVQVLDMTTRAAPREGAGIDSGIKPEKI